MVYSNKKVYKGIFYPMFHTFIIGYWRQGKKHGHGLLKYANSDEFEGYFANDIKHGKGTMTFATGDIKEGYWQNDQYIGKTQKENSDGKALIAKHRVRVHVGLL